MRRASALALVALLTSPARADDEIPQARPAVAAGPVGPGAPGELHAQLAAQLAGESTSVASALATVQGKLTAADAARTRRARSAARVLHTTAAADAPDADRLAAARRAAAARLLLARDAGERGLLSDEVGRLRIAAARIATEAGAVAAVVAPTELAWPVKGTVARKYGPFEHEHSKAQLSRRGLDLEVEDHAQVVAPADGTVRYAGPIRGLDAGVIIDAGPYLVVVAKLADPAVPVGTEVHKGDRIGRAARHRVYLEVRVALGAGGLPIDPETVLPHDGAGGKPKRRAAR